MFDFTTLADDVAIYGDIFPLRQLPMRWVVLTSSRNTPTNRNFSSGRPRLIRLHGERSAWQHGGRERNARGVLPQTRPSICYEYDERLLLKRTTRGCCSPGAAITAYSYELDGRLIATTGPRGNMTTRKLDALGRPIGVTDPVGTLQRIDYDQLNNTTVHRWFGTQANGMYPLLRRTEFLYDEHNQLVRVRQAVFASPIPAAHPWAAPDAEYEAALAVA